MLKVRRYIVSVKDILQSKGLQIYIYAAKFK